MAFSLNMVAIRGPIHHHISCYLAPVLWNLKAELFHDLLWKKMLCVREPCGWSDADWVHTLCYTKYQSPSSDGEKQLDWSTTCLKETEKSCYNSTKRMWAILVQEIDYFFPAVFELQGWWVALRGMLRVVPGIDTVSGSISPCDIIRIKIKRQIQTYKIRTERHSIWLTDVQSLLRCTSEL